MNVWNLWIMEGRRKSQSHVLVFRSLFGDSKGLLDRDRCRLWTGLDRGAYRNPFHLSLGQTALHLSLVNGFENGFKNGLDGEW